MGVLVVSLVVAALTMPATPPARAAATVFDDFNGSAGAQPDAGKWSVVDGTGWDAGIQNYTSGSSVLDGHGHLALQARKVGSGYATGRVQTKNKASFGYGTLVAQIKMPSGLGLWPAFWLVGADGDSNPWPGAGEIDIVEMVSEPSTQYSSLHGPVADVWHYLQDQIITRSSDLSGDFPNYWMTRTKDSITVGVDRTTCEPHPTSLPPSATWVFNKPFYVILNLAVGGGWAGLPDSTTEFPATMLVDWVNWEPA